VLRREIIGIVSPAKPQLYWPYTPGPASVPFPFRLFPRVQQQVAVDDEAARLTAGEAESFRFEDLCDLLILRVALRSNSLNICRAGATWTKGPTAQRGKRLR